jgi:PAS domain S-box-containing protein
MFITLVTRVIFALLSSVLPILLIGQLSVPAYAREHPQVGLTRKNILILHSHEANAPVFVGTDKGLSTTLESGGIQSLNQFFESLDLRRNPGPDHRRLLVEHTRVQYSHRKLDMIITMFPEALEFVLKDCRDIFRDIPILALYLPEGFELPKTDRPIIGHSAKTDILGTFEIALKLVPGAKRVYVVSGAHEIDRKIEDRARRELKKWESRLEFLYLSRMPFEDILTALSTAPSDTIILLLIYTEDVTGRSYTSPNLTQRLSQVSTAPIFGLLDAALGHGIAGGSLINFERIGTKAGELVLDILRGAPTTQNIPEFLDVPPVPMFDWRQLRRWKLSEAALPKGSIVINREFTLLEFKYYIIGGIAVFLAQTTLVIGLLVQRRRKMVAEESLKQKTEELDQFFNVNLDLLCIANTDGYFLRLNPAWEKTLGYTEEELMAKRFLDFVHPDDVYKTQEAVSALRSQNQLFLFENRYRCKDGTYRWLEWSSAPAGNLIYSAARDITESKRAEAEAFQARNQLLQLDRLSRMGELTASLAHELNQPLAAILSNAQAGLRFLQSDKIDFEELREILHDITQDDQRAGSVIRSLRSMVKREEMERTPIILNNVLNDVVRIFHTESVFRNMRVETKFDGSLPPVPGDKVQLQQVALNLILNAADVMSHNPPEYRQIILGTGVKDDRVRVTVRDFGPGIDRGNLERIFEPFFTTKGAGLGMGLNICRTIVEAHGGRIWAENNPDRGATFVFEIPAESNE